MSKKVLMEDQGQITTMKEMLPRLFEDYRESAAPQIAEWLMCWDLLVEERFTVLRNTTRSTANVSIVNLSTNVHTCIVHWIQTFILIIAKSYLCKPKLKLVCYLISVYKIEIDFHKLKIEFIIITVTIW